MTNWNFVECFSTKNGSDMEIDWWYVAKLILRNYKIKWTINVVRIPILFQFLSSDMFKYCSNFLRIRGQKRSWILIIYVKANALFKFFRICYIFYSFLNKSSLNAWKDIIKTSIRKSSKLCYIFSLLPLLNTWAS